MILAEKIMQLRKKNGWSQEELAGRLGVSRQSVSKWESAMSIPDLDKILQMSEVFEVSTDYLLKDEITEEVYVPGNPDVGTKADTARKISMEEAQEYMKVCRTYMNQMGLSVAAAMHPFSSEQESTNNQQRPAPETFQTQKKVLVNLLLNRFTRTMRFY